jgi:deazaflavin-dependent oxidoreductase (nitroreductase family)
MTDFNQQIIEEFRANGGKVSGRFAGAPLVLLTTTGARTGAQRTTPLVCLDDGDRWLIFGSAAGSDRHPDWFHNVLAHPEVTVELGTDDGIETVHAFAVPLEGPERDAAYARQVEVMPGFGEYQERTDRVIPVVALTRAG